MRQLWWRQWLRGPKHGVARGVAVHRCPGLWNDAAGLADLLADRCQELRGWARGHEIDLDDSPDSLTALDRALDSVSEDIRSLLDNDCGVYLGTVIVRHQPHARWHVWPNGHPVVRLASGRELDVVAAVHDQADAGQSRLAALYADAAR